MANEKLELSMRDLGRLAHYLETTGVSSAAGAVVEWIKLYTTSENETQRVVAEITAGYEEETTIRDDAVITCLRGFLTNRTDELFTVDDLLAATNLPHDRRAFQKLAIAAAALGLRRTKMRHKNRLVVGYRRAVALMGGRYV